MLEMESGFLLNPTRRGSVEAARFSLPGLLGSVPSLVFTTTIRSHAATASRLR